ncbi:PAS domain S-box protein [Pyxidicoccus sp. MSG2]|uniref:PAS domain S-box protein n=1 Tax=Pyxidicoccus sp. MSG2 TaxID=2996790 RepID=UPI00226F73EE|nr:PAS domain S-box protein [Pyxidicoccus sp. MSG2]MCY1014559.1 PAS domain S-box protein [Pyxidicoccus sp. MSG2]
MMMAEARTEESSFSDWTSQFDAIAWAADAATLQLTRVSPNAAGILGYPVEQWWSEPDFLARHLHPDDRDAALALYQDGPRRRPKRSGVHRFLSASGQALPFLSKVLTLERGEGRAPELRCLMLRLEEDTRAGQGLEHSHSLLRATLESTADGLLVVDTQGRIVDFNTQFLELWGIPEEVIATRDDKRALAYVLTRLVDPAAFLAKVEALYSTPEARSFDVLEFRDGRTLERYSQPQRLGDRIVGRVWSFRDVTDRKRSERERDVLLLKEKAARARAEALAEQLKAGESRFHRIFESHVIGLVLSDTHGRILQANDAFLNIVGYSREDLAAGRINFLAITAPEFQAVTRRAVEEIEASGVASTFEKEYVRKDGRRVPVLLGSVRLPEQDQNATFVLDLTERKAAIAERERFFRLAPDIFCIAGMDGTFKRVNPAFTRVVGWSEEELLSRPFLQLVHPADQQVAQETLDNLTRGIPNPGRILRCACKDGSWKSLAWTAVPVMETGLIYASARDVTWQGEAEERRVLAEERLRTVINSAPLVLAVLDADGRVVLSEGKGLQGLGLAPGQAVGQSAFEFYTDVPSVVENMRRGLRGETFSTMASVSGRTFEVFYQPLLDDAGRVTSLSIAALDVTERVRVEAEREELIRQVTSERSILQAVLQQLPHAVYIAEAPSGRIILVNTQATTQVRSPYHAASNIEEYRGYPGFHPDGRLYEPHEWPLARAVTHGEVVKSETIDVLRDDGRRGTVEYSATPVRDARGRITHGVVVGVDITARREAEKERERLLEELRLAVSARDEFLGIASHELKTPLTPLALKLEALARAAGAEPESPLARRVAPHVEVMRRQVKRLASLVNDLLDVSSIRAGRLALTLKPQECDLAALVRDVASRFDTEAKRAGCEVHLHAPAPVQGTWDGSRLEQVVTNLLANAVKYGPGHPVTLSVEAVGGRARLTVRDVGIGIAPENLQRIWGKFERAVSERHYGGLGLGLYISRQIVEALGGTVRAESALGQGATFIVELPLESTEAGTQLGCLAPSPPA